MRYKKFSIENYKAIESLTIILNRNVIPLIGINESGKTSILQAILAFDKDKDNNLNSTHINPKNKYKTTQSDCKLVASVEIESEEEFNSIGEEICLSMEDPLYVWLRSAFDNHKEISIQRECADMRFLNTYFLVNEPQDILSNRKTERLVKAIVKRLPNILYFDDFSDRVPEEVGISRKPDNTIELGRGKNREWQEIIIEIFSRALNEEFSLETFLNLNDEDDQENYLNDVSKTLNSEIIDEWKKLKTSHSGFSEDSDSLELSLKYFINSDNKPTFRFKVTDSEDSGNDRVFDINQRSKGFQWFFNFIMKLKFNPKYKSNPKNAIYLLDEPGSYLHSSAQTELLKKLCEIGEDNTIIYCTHSQYLLDPEVINIGGIKIVSKADGHISLTDYGNSSLSKHLGAFSALYDALHLKFGFHEHILHNCILVEGIIDYYFFKMFFDFGPFEIIPGTGCGHLSALISILISCSDKFVVVLDNDNEGRIAYQKYSKTFGEILLKRIYQYDGVNNGRDYELEDILSLRDKRLIMDSMECNDIKNAIVAMFFKDEAIKKRIIDNIDSETKNNINIIQQRIKNFFLD